MHNKETENQTSDTKLGAKHTTNSSDESNDGPKLSTLLCMVALSPKRATMQKQKTWQNRRGRKCMVVQCGAKVPMVA